MSGGRLFLMAAAGALLGATLGFLLGWLLWRLGFELLGSAVTLVGASVGGIVGLLGVMRWSDRRAEARRSK